MPIWETSCLSETPLIALSATPVGAGLRRADRARAVQLCGGRRLHTAVSPAREDGGGRFRVDISPLPPLHCSTHSKGDSMIRSMRLALCALVFAGSAMAAGDDAVPVTADLSGPGPKIDRNIFGQF